MQTNFRFRSLLADEREEAMHFIEHHEVECVVLMEKLLESTEDVYVIENLTKNKFCALFYLKSNSTLYYYLPFLVESSNQEYLFSKPELAEIKNLILQFLSKSRIFCIYGEFVGGNYLQELMQISQKKMIASFDYYLLKNDFSKKEYVQKISEEDLTKLTVRKCSTQDIPKLINLERGYRKEEVQITEREESDAIIRFILESSIRSQTVFAAWQNDGEKCPIAKAATNARGKQFYQIGGVYCDKNYRCRGIANYVLRQLLEYIQQEGKHASLFVKEKNESAKKLYENLNFVIVGKYQISYFQN